MNNAATTCSKRSLKMEPCLSAFGDTLEGSTQNCLEKTYIAWFKSRCHRAPKQHGREDPGESPVSVWDHYHAACAQEGEQDPAG